MVVITTLKRKKRHIRWDRVAILISPIIIVIILVITITGKEERKKDTQPIPEVIEVVEIKEEYDGGITSDSDSTNNISPSVKLEYLGEFRLTGYCDCEICQEEWVGTTALGVPPTERNTIAVDPNVIPLGSYVWIDGIRYHAEDVGGMINDQHIDVFVGSHEGCYAEFCNGYHDVYLEVSES